MKIFLVFFGLFVGLSAGKVLKVFNNVTDFQYSQMPSLFQLDNYDDCLLLKSKSLYCFATIQLTPANPENPSEVWRIIEETIELERNYRHDRLRHGICVQEVCPEIPASLYKVGNGSEELWRGLSDCYTAKYKELGLKGQVVKMQCENHENFYKVDFADKVYAVCLLGLALLVLTATLHDYLTKKKTDFTTVEKISQCFSLRKNFGSLIGKPGHRVANFRAFEGIRVLNMFFIITFHVGLVFVTNPVQNTQFVENLTLNPAYVMFTNLGLFCQTFFVISGWLSSYNICHDFHNRPFTITQLPQQFIHRIIRVLPVLIAMLGFNATWLRHSNQGPLWQHTIHDEFQNCRKNYLSNLLFVNNYHNEKHMCLIQSWYICSEIQAFVLGLFIMYFVLKRPKFAREMFTIFITLSIAVGVFEHFHRQHDIVFRSYPEIVYNFFLQSETWHAVYSAGHYQFPCYFLGLAGGYFYHKKVTIEKKTYQIHHINSSLLLLILMVFMFVVLISPWFFYRNGFEMTRFFAAFYQNFYRIAFGFPVIFLIFLCSIGQGGKFRRFFELNVLQFLAKLSFSVYMSHISFLRFRHGNARSPFHVSTQNVLMSTFGDICVSYMVAMVVCLMVELPIRSLQKTFSGQKFKTS